jgi:endoglucanase
MSDKNFQRIHLDQLTFMKRSFLLLLPFIFFSFTSTPQAWIRINLLGYKPNGTKVAVWCSKENTLLKTFQVVAAGSGKVVFEQEAGKPSGAYGPFVQTYRLNFSSFTTPGKYFLRTGETLSPSFVIHEDCYKGAADFSLRYMRQQRSGFNPYLKDSCHTRDGYTMYGPMPDSTHIDVSGGWHDATDYLQYSMTSANATFHLLAAYRDFPGVFTDAHLANGLEGRNKMADVLDEAKWGLDWLLKMHPRPDWLFNQLADDRDHIGFRLPTNDKANYGKGFERPVYFVTGGPQGLSKYKNRTTGTSSVAGKFSSAFALGHALFRGTDTAYASLLKQRAMSAYAFGLKKPGATQTACYKSPYFYEEDNWVDDLELAAAQLYSVTNDKKLLQASLHYARQEKHTPWLGKDTAGHYQWYPFINPGHYALAKAADAGIRKEITAYYKEGIEMVWKKANRNAFYRGVPFIWCSNNLQAAFAIQCYWYRMLSGDNTYAELEQATFDWLLGCNPWGTSMVVGLPADGDHPDDPHSSLNHLYGYQTLGALVDGPVYGSIFKQQAGVRLLKGDDYEAFQSPQVVYHDDVGDYATNEPTMDGTASLIYLLAAQEDPTSKEKLRYNRGAVIRGDTTQKRIALVFAGHSFADGGEQILRVLKNKKAKASFFLTGDFYRTPSFQQLIKKLKAADHYLGAHSDKHLLYCDWTNRDSLFVTKNQFQNDLLSNYAAMQALGIPKTAAPYFLPPYEWYNDSIAAWTKELGLTLINFSPGTLSHADYTTPGMSNYRSSDTIFQSITTLEQKAPEGLSGFILLMHIGTDPHRTDKFYTRLEALLDYLQDRKYTPVRIDDLLK